MATMIRINHVALVVDNLERACDFYEKEFNLSPLPAYKFDYPAQFYKINEDQQLHLTEWKDKPSFRGHVCIQVDDFNAVFWRMKELSAIDITPWGKVRRLPDGGMQMFVRDPSQNLVEISCPADTPVDESIFEDDLVERKPGIYVSNRDDDRGYKSDAATLYHGKKPDGQEPS